MRGIVKDHKVITDTSPPIGVDEFKAKIDEVVSVAESEGWTDIKIDLHQEDPYYDELCARVDIRLIGERSETDKEMHDREDKEWKANIAVHLDRVCKAIDGSRIFEIEGIEIAFWCESCYRDGRLTESLRRQLEPDDNPVMSNLLCSVCGKTTRHIPTLITQQKEKIPSTLPRRTCRSLSGQVTAWPTPPDEFKVDGTVTGSVPCQLFNPRKKPGTEPNEEDQSN